MAAGLLYHAWAVPVVNPVAEGNGPEVMLRKTFAGAWPVEGIGVEMIGVETGIETGTAIVESVDIETGAVIAAGASVGSETDVAGIAMLGQFDPAMIGVTGAGAGIATEAGAGGGVEGIATGTGAGAGGGAGAGAGVAAA